MKNFLFLTGFGLDWTEQVDDAANAANAVAESAGSWQQNLIACLAGQFTWIPREEWSEENCETLENFGVKLNLDVRAL